MTHNPERISVVVPAYNEATLIRGTLDSLTHQRTDVECHVIVVDNNSTDDTPGIVDDYPGVTLLHEPAQGTGYAANTGFQYAIEEDHPAVIMRTDADTVPIQDWVETARYYLAEHSSKQLISGLVRPLKDEYYRWSDEILLPASYVAYRIGVSAIKATL